jgi:hypothetical protein
VVLLAGLMGVPLALQALARWSRGGGAGGLAPRRNSSAPVQIPGYPTLGVGAYTWARQGVYRALVEPYQDKVYWWEAALMVHRLVRRAPPVMSVLFTLRTYPPT